MPWVKLDDQFFRNSKAMAAGRDGRSLYLAGLCLCAQALTDGFVADAALPSVAADAGVRPSVARRLVEVGLWQRVEGGHVIPDFLEYNPSADKVKAERAAARERQRRHRNGVTGDVTNAVGSETPIPSRPSDVVKSSSSSPVLAVDEDDDPVWMLVARRRLRDERQRGATITREAGWLRTTARNARDEHGAEAATLRAQFDLTAQELANVLCGERSILRFKQRAEGA